MDRKLSDIQQVFENVRVRGRRDLWIPRLSHCVLRRRCHWLSRHTCCVYGALLLLVAEIHTVRHAIV